MRWQLLVLALCSCTKPAPVGTTTTTDAAAPVASVRADAGTPAAAAQPDPVEVPLPTTWPKSVPLYPGTKVYSVEPTEAHGLELRGEAPASAVKVGAFYKKQLRGYQVAPGDFNAADQQGYSFSRGGKWQVSLMATGPEDDAVVVLTVDPSLLSH